MFNLWSTQMTSTPDENVEATLPEASNTPLLAGLRAAAVPLRAVTQATLRTHSTSDDGRLQLPSSNPQAGIRNISRSRSPSPLPTTSTTPSTTHFPFAAATTPSTMDEDMQLKKDRDQRDHQTKQATEAAVKAALEHQAASTRPHRKPDLPNLDKRHIDQTGSLMVPYDANTDAILKMSVREPLLLLQPQTKNRNP